MGPRCSVCQPGYGKTGVNCQACLSTAANWVLMAVVGSALLGLMYFLVVQSIQAGADAIPGQKKDVLPIVVKMLLNHMQVTAIVGLSNESVPGQLATFFRGTQQSSSFSPNLSFMTCDATPTYDKQFTVIAAAPYVVFVIFAVVHLLRLVRERVAGGDDE